MDQVRTGKRYGLQSNAMGVDVVTPQIGATELAFCRLLPVRNVFSDFGPKLQGKIAFLFGDPGLTCFAQQLPSAEVDAAESK